MLGRGLAGVEISSFAGDVELSDERLEPFWARAAELGCIVFLHPFGCSLDERLDRFYLSNTVGQPTENAVALSHLIFAGVLDRHPGLKIVAAHGGGYLPTVIGRSDRAWDVRPGGPALRARPSTYLRKLWFDTVVHDERTLRALVEVAGADRGRARQRLPVRHGPRRPGRVRCGIAGLADEVTSAILARQRRGARGDTGAGMRIARWAGRGRRSARASSSTTASSPFPDGLTVADVLAAGLDAAHETCFARVGLDDAEPGIAARRRHAARPARPRRDPRLRRLRGARRGSERRRSTARARSSPEWYQAPTFYFTNPHTVLGPGEAVAPPVTERLDFELEVAAVVGGVAGSDGANLHPDAAASHIFGYTIMNDWSARDLQAREMKVRLGPAKGKDFGTTLGPWIVTADELDALPRRRRASSPSAPRCFVNGELIGEDLVSNMGWPFPELVAYASRNSRVVPGDVLGSGTVGNGGCLGELWGRNGALDPAAARGGRRGAHGRGGHRRTRRHASAPAVAGARHPARPPAQPRPPALTSCGTLVAFKLKMA